MRELLALLLGLAVGLSLYEFGDGALNRMTRNKLIAQQQAENEKNEIMRKSREERDDKIDKLVTVISALTEQVRKER